MNLEIIIIAVIVSSACALCGVFLVLRKMSLMGDAISHSILIGNVHLDTDSVLLGEIAFALRLSLHVSVL